MSHALPPRRRMGPRERGLSGTGEFEAHALAAKFPTMDDKDFAALVADIKANGQREPIVIFQGKILDGRHRALACKQLGIEPITKTFDGDKAAAVLLADSLNVHRRHLTREQRRELIVAELKRDPSQSDRAIAEKARVSPTSVGSARAELEATVQIGQSETRIGKNGVEKPTTKRPRGVGASKRTQEERVNEIRALAAAGNNIEQIAAAQGIGVQWVSRIMDSAGVKLAIPKTATTHASAERVANGTVDTLVGVAQGLEIFRGPGMSLTKDLALTLLPEMREAMKSIRWFEQQLKEAANG